MMLISGPSFPALPAYSGQSLPQQDNLGRQSSAEDRYQGQTARQQTVEYIFKGQWDEASSRVDQDYRQNLNIDPARRNAIYSYLDNLGLSAQQAQRQGRLVDIFI